MANTKSITVLEAQLKNPFPKNLIKWRVGATTKDKTKGIALPYIDARDVAKRLDDIMGVDAWQKKLTRAEGGWICSIGLKVAGEWVWKEDAAGDTRIDPIKGGASDAFKRAGAAWGIGRYLYYLQPQWVPIKKDKYDNYVLESTPGLPDWARSATFTEDWEEIAEREQQANQQEIPTENSYNMSDASKADIIKANQDANNK